MSSLSPECNNLKQRYDSCFTKWYAEKFLNGDSKPACEDVLLEYKECVWKAIKAKNVDKLIDDAKKAGASLKSESPS
eukprot:jgi/Hompol1/6740/HPOL_003318-RA